LAEPTNILIHKLNLFIKKYYKNELLKGLMLFVSFALAFFLIIAVLEYFAWFPTAVRTVLFYLYIGVNLFVAWRFVAIPVFRLFRIGKTITHEQAARIIGRFFPEVSDKLLNALQLQAVPAQNTTSAELLEASINQKIRKLSPIPFTAAIDFRINKKYLKYVLPPTLILVVILIVSPAIVTEPSNRIINYTTFFEKQAPFRFVVLNTDLKAVQQQDFQLNVKLTGDQIPNEVYLVSSGNEYKLTKETIVIFHHTFKNLQKDQSFYLRANGFRSKEYTISVIPKPIILDFELQLNYPAYTGKKNETLQNSGDLSVPCGTEISWKIKTKDTKKLWFQFIDKSFFLQPGSDNQFAYSRHFFVTQNYSVATYNEFIKNPDSLQYNINVIPDAYPYIDLKEYHDSLFDSHLYFKGMIKDDYGFNKLLFKYKKTDSDNKEEPEQTRVITINKLLNRQDFYYYFDLSGLGVQPGDNIEYYFEVWDNDAIKGSKATRSQKMIFKVPTLDEIQKQTDQNNDNVKDKIDETIKDINQLQKQIDDLNKKLLDKKTLDWQERKQIEDLVNKQQQMQKNVDDLKQQIHQNSVKEQQFKTVDPSILEKQKQLEDLFNKVMTDEMKDMFKQMQDMLDKLDKNKVNEMLDKMKLSNKDIEKELDRNLELFKQLEFEKKMSETIDKLQKLSEQQKNLSEQTKDENNKSDKLLVQQKDVNNQFNDAKKDLQNLDDLNKKLENPKNLEKTDEKQNSIQQELNNSQNQLQNNKRKNASKSQQNAAEQMEQLANDLQKNQDEMQDQADEEDARSLREILENLLRVSFGQEDLIAKLKNTNVSDPKYTGIMDKQKDLKDDLGMIEDSLQALSKRQAMIQPLVNREISQINDNVTKSLELLHNRNVSTAQKSQQYVMTSVNNLALLLAESLQQMEQQNKNKSNKSCKGGSCKKPGGGKPSAASMKMMQEMLNKQMDALKKQMENVGKTGDPGKSGQDGQSINEQLARLAAQQEAIRQMMQQYGEDLKKEGTGNDGNINEIVKKMDQTETDLVNKVINAETQKRQKEILTRLLESEKAEKERELDDKRESNEAKEKIYSNPNQFFEYKRLKSQELELLKTIPVTLTPFFKYKANEYFYNFAD